MLNNIASSDQSKLGGVVATNSSNTTDELQSYYGRATASIKDKYILTGTIRADGSTRFGGDNKYGYFPSGAFKWRLSEESFIPDAFSDLNLRVSYGVTGNQQFGHNLYTQRRRYGGLIMTGRSTLVLITQRVAVTDLYHSKILNLNGNRLHSLILELTSDSWITG